MSVIEFLPAQLKSNSHGWYIEYQTFNPNIGKMQRFRTHVNVLRKHYPRLADFKAHCNGIINTINAKLAGGWSPIGENQNARFYTSLSVVIRAYLAEKQDELRPDTLRSYKSFCTIFGAWVNENVPDCQAILFNKVLAIRYLDYCSVERKLKGRSWNNQLKAARALFSWAVAKCYCKENPFGGIKPKREAEKRRVLIPADTRKRITAYCKENNLGLLIVSQLVYSSLIRPKEIRCLKVSDVFLKEHYILIRPEVAKTHFARIATMNPILEGLVADWIKGANGDDYLIGSKDYAAGKKPIPHSRFSKDWIEMRKALHLTDEMELYSLRDTGINEMLKCGIDPLTVMQHADHHDLSMTTRYANHVDPHLVETISKKAPNF